jgi:hypothetical protein
MENLTFQHVQNLINEFHHFTQSYQVKINKLKDQLTTAQHTITAYEHFLKDHMMVDKAKIERITQNIVDCADRHQ